MARKPPACSGEAAHWAGTMITFSMCCMCGLHKSEHGQYSTAADVRSKHASLSRRWSRPQAQYQRFGFGTMLATVRRCDHNHVSLLQELGAAMKMPRAQPAWARCSGQPQPVAIAAAHLPKLASASNSAPAQVWKMFQSTAAERNPFTALHCSTSRLTCVALNSASQSMASR